MKKTVKAIGITAALAVMIPLSAYAATTATGYGGAANKASTQTMGKDAHPHFVEGGFRFIAQDVLDLLKLDEAALKSKLAAGQTLAQIAEAQGVSRDTLKKALTDSFNKQLEEQKKAFSDRVDGMIDQKGGGQHEKGFAFKGFADLGAVAKTLGVTDAELKTALASDKSIADIAKEKGIDVQKVIDAQKAAVTDAINQSVKDGKLTQAEADKRLADAAKIAEKIVNGRGFEHGHEDGESDHHK